MKPFPKQLLTWFDKHGRKNLPWQQNINPYRVWISEIMLQQTQVQTVIPYYKKFMQSFPDVISLANANEDDVLHHWTGLGYYARARNLHKTAKTITNKHKGIFPESAEALTELPGIGRSTAGAIISLSMQKYAVILDGNVKRILCRHYAITGYPGNTQIQKQLWQLAEQNTPKQRTADYTQAIMDLGAMLCTRTKSQCEHCPLIKTCKAYASGKQYLYPEKKPRKTLPIRQTHLLMLCHNGKILLEKRPPLGIWGSLWSLPETNTPQQWCEQKHLTKIKSQQTWQLFRHTFSHFHLDIKPTVIELAAVPNHIMESDQLAWYNIGELPAKGLAAPVKKLLKQLQEVES